MNPHTLLLNALCRYETALADARVAHAQALTIQDGVQGFVARVAVAALVYTALVDVEAAEKQVRAVRDALAQMGGSWVPEGAVVQ